MFQVEFDLLVFPIVLNYDHLHCGTGILVSLT